MNISIDDLVSSFSASHVSQEAMDIATLQVVSLPLSPLFPSFSLHSVPALKIDLLSLSSPTRRTVGHPSQQLCTAMQHTHPLLSNRIFSLGMGGLPFPRPKYDSLCTAQLRHGRGDGRRTGRRRPPKHTHPNPKPPWHATTTATTKVPPLHPVAALARHPYLR